MTYDKLQGFAENVSTVHDGEIFIRDLKQRRRRRKRDLKITFNSRFLNKFAMIYTPLVCKMWPNYPGANVVGAALKFRKRNGNLSSCVKTLNLVISRRCFAEGGKEMYESV